MKEERFDIDKMEHARFEIETEAFQPGMLHCSPCNKKMKKTGLEIQIDKDFYLRMEGFECAQCKKKYLGLEEAKKLDKAMIVSRALYKGFKMERHLSFDGDNYTFRIPKEFTQEIHKKKIEIIPLGANEFCAVVE